VASIYSAGSASVQIVPDFTNAQRRIGQWFSQQNDMKVKVKPDLSNAELAGLRARVESQRPDMKVGVDKKHLSKQMVMAVDFMTGTSAVQNALMKLFNIRGMIITNLAGAGVAIGSALGAGLTHAVVASAAMLPALISAAAIPIGTAILGSQGIGDAFKALGGTTQADAKKLAEAMKNLAPAARDFVTQVHSLAPAFKDLRLDVQQHLFAGLGDTIKNLGQKMLPMLRGHLTGIADEIGGMGKAIAGALSSDSNVADFAHTIDNVKVALHGITGAIAPLWSVFQNLATVGSDFLPGLTKGFGDLATRFAAFIQNARDTGQLRDFIAGIFNGLKDIWGVAKNLGGILKSVFTSAMPAGEQLVKILKIFSGDLNDFLGTDLAQNSLHKFFEGLTSAIGSLTPGLTSLTESLVTSVLPAMSGLAQVVAPIVSTLLVQFADLLRTLGPLFYPALANALSVALGALTPLIDVFSHLATTVLPVVIDAIRRVAPLFAKLAEGIGEALVRAIEIVAPLLPKLVDAIQAIAEALVPFILQVVNLAVDFLPPLVAVLGGLAKALEFIAPMLPILVTGFVALKVVGGLSILLEGLAAKLLAAAIATDVLSTSTTGLVRRGMSNALLNAAGGAEKLKNAMGAIGPIAAGVGVFFGLFLMAIQDADQKTNAWAEALLKGGQAARTAAAEMATVHQNVEKVTTGFTGFIAKFTFGGDALQTAAKHYDTAGQKATELWKAMSPLEQATSKVEYWQNELNYRLKEYGQGSPEVEAAQRRFHYWSGEVAHQQDMQGEATKTATQRIQEQADAQRATVDAQLAYEQAVLGVHSAMAEYNKTMADGTATDDDRSRASIGVRQSILDVADAAKKKAEQENAGKDATVIAGLANQAYLQTLKDQAAQLSGPAKDAMDAYIRDYENMHGPLAQARADVADLGVTIKGTPDSKHIEIDAPTEDQKRRLMDLGYRIDVLPGGKTVIVDVDTAAGKAEIDNFVALIEKKNPKLHVNIVGNTLVSVGGLGGQGGLHQAQGGIVHAFRDGGFEPMKAGIAQVVKPNTWRIIGDRVKDDEAYIPLNSDPRSQTILATAADQMGFGLVENAAGNLFAPPGMSSVYTGPGRESLAAAERDAAARRASRGGIEGGASTIAGFVNNGTVVTTDLDEISRKSRIGTQRALAVAGL
jgi:hypothetical protein